ncbi:hypothetical protein AAMO2058_000987600 [Amorphochlora amoebiformis]
MGASSSGGITVEDGRRLLESHVPNTEEKFWGKFWGPGARSDVWLVLDPQFLRALMLRRPENLKTLMKKTTLQLECLVGLSKGPSSEERLEIIACVQILTRCVQVVNEDPEETFSLSYLWIPTPPPPSAPPPSEGKGLVNESGAEQKPGPETAESKATEIKASAASGDGETKVEGKIDKETEAKGSKPKKSKEPVLATRIVAALCKALFVPGLTLDPNTGLIVESNDEGELVLAALHPAAGRPGPGPFGVLPGLLWEPGLEIIPASKSAPLPTPPAQSAYHIDQNRVVVLHALMVALSGPLFRSPEDAATTIDRWGAALGSHRLAPTVYFSLLNVITSYRTPSASLYNFLTTFPRVRTELVEAALQVLLVLLNHRGGVPKPRIRRTPSEIQAGVMDAPPKEAKSGKKVKRKEPNKYLELFKAMRHPSQIKRIYGSLCHLLKACQESRSVFVNDPLECYQECFVLLWKLLEENPKFVKIIVEQCDVLELLRPLLFFMFSCRNDASKLGLLYSCVFILLRLSGERQFCVALNEEYDGSLSMDLPTFKGTHADLLILTCQKVVVSSAEHLNSMLNGVLTVIFNCSPYLTSLAMISSVKLLNLFELVTKPKFLYGAPANPSYAALLLDIFNNLIQYQYSGCPDLVYAIVRRSKLFYDLVKIPSFLERDEPKPKPIQMSGESKKAREEKVSAKSPVAPSDGNAADIDSTEGKRKILNGDRKVSASQAPQPAAAVPSEESFKASKEWVQSWQRELRMETILRLLDFLIPKFHIKAAAQGGVLTSTDGLLEVIRTTTLVGVLPAPHQIVVNKYVPNAVTTSWFSTFLWGIVYLRNPHLFSRDFVQLFPIYDVDEDEDLEDDDPYYSPTPQSGIPSEN